MKEVMKMNPKIFREYDIRGICDKDIDENIMEKIGSAFAKFIFPQTEIVVCRDFRLSSPPLQAAFAQGAYKKGLRIIDIGALPLGTAFFYAWKNGNVLAYITASHLTKEWNGIKFYYPDGICIGGNELQKIRVIAESLENEVNKDKKEIVKKDPSEIVENYINYFINIKKPTKRIKVVIDSGNGATGVVAPSLFSKAGFEVISLFTEPDGNFPNRESDPTSNPLEDLRTSVISHKADMGIAYDGDGDRMVIVDNLGRKLSPEQSSWFILSFLLKERLGPVAANIECTRTIDKIAEKFNRPVCRMPVGHTHLKIAVVENNAAFGVESSGHYLIPHLTPIDDSIALTYWAACALSGSNKHLSDIVDEAPNNPVHRMSFPCPDEKKFKVVERLRNRLVDEYENTNTIDGVRVDFKDSWVLIRASNTEPLIRMTMEAASQEGFEKIKEEFSRLLEDEIRKIV